MKEKEMAILQARISKKVIGLNKYSTDNVFVVTLFVNRTYIDSIFIAYRWYVNGFIYK